VHTQNLDFMKDLKLIALVILVSTVLSCQDTDEPEINTLTGTYIGTINIDEANKSSLSNSSKDIVAVVKTKGDQLEVHCHGEGIDITLMLDYFEHYENYMTCLTGDDYQNLYKHAHGEGMMPGGGMNNMHQANTAWMQHVNNTHNPNDEHLNGEFNLKNHTFKCTFNWQETRLTFTGTKSN